MEASTTLHVVMCFLIYELEMISSEPMKIYLWHHPLEVTVLLVSTTVLFMALSLTEALKLAIPDFPSVLTCSFRDEEHSPELFWKSICLHAKKICNRNPKNIHSQCHWTIFYTELGKSYNLINLTITSINR